MIIFSRYPLEKKITKEFPKGILNTTAIYGPTELFLMKWIIPRFVRLIRKKIL